MGVATQSTLAKALPVQPTFAQGLFCSDIVVDIAASINVKQEHVSKVQCTWE